MKKFGMMVAVFGFAALVAGGCAKDRATATEAAGEDAMIKACASGCGAKDGNACTKAKADCCGASHCGGTKKAN